MKALRVLVCAMLFAALMVTAAGVATANDNTLQPNHQMAPGVWYYSWIGPGSLEFGVPDQGTMWQKDFEGEVRYIDSKFMAIAADGSGDIMNFYLYPNLTECTPSFDGVRVGSHVKVRSDDRHRVRWVKVVPFHEWLHAQSK
jgi:hypothetical protein